MYQIAHERWKIFGQVLADAQAWIFSVVFYYTIMVPFGVGMRLLGDPLALKGEVAWLDRDTVGESLEDARRQG